MELTKKTTILFPPPLYAHLTEVARQRGVSVGQLVRDACEAQYGSAQDGDRAAALEALVALSLPVGSPKEMKEQSVPRPEDIAP